MGKFGFNMTFVANQTSELHKESLTSLGQAWVVVKVVVFGHQS